MPAASVDTTCVPHRQPHFLANSEGLWRPLGDTARKPSSFRPTPSLEGMGSVASFKYWPKPEVVGDAFKPNRIDRFHPHLSFRNGPAKQGVVDAGKRIGGGNISEITAVNEAIARRCLQKGVCNPSAIAMDIWSGRRHEPIQKPF